MRSAVLGVALTACTAINPAFDEAVSHSSSAGETTPGETTPPTTSPGESTVDSTDTTSTTASQSATSDPADSSSTPSTDSSSGGPVCAAQNEACSQGLPCCGECATCTDGVCLLDDGLCGTCGVCIAGSCAPAKQNTPCLPDQDDCANRVWGLMDGVCYATKPYGECNKEGACVPDCQDQGEVITMCDPRCVTDPQACAPGGDPDKLTFDVFCHHDNLPAGGCQSECDPGGTFVYANVCDPAGLCMPQSSTACEPYRCMGTPGVCTSNCMSNLDCAPDHMCVNNACQ